ncbi:MAG: response regulator, partial [Betaproteobacteria bacterium]|nr:response regulator [Betaproteobacteria bacterium]
HFLVTLLGYHGHRLLEAADGNEALEIAQAELPEVVIADVLMPKMDGYELARRLRAESRLADTVVIFHTAYYRDGEAERLAKECGVEIMLPKPCEPEVVLSTLAKALATGPSAVAVEPQFDRDHLQVVSTRLYETVNALTRAQGMAKLAHIITGPDGGFESWSETLPGLIGRDTARVPRTTRDWLDLLHEEDRAKFRETCIEAGTSHRRRDIEYRLARADGAWVHIRQIMEPLERAAKNGKRVRWFNTLQDVSEQKGAEQQLTAMTQRLVVLQEKERRDIARELHDRVGQNLASLNLNLSRLRVEPGGADAAARIAESIALVEQTGLVVQDVLTELKPPMLASYGLVDALRFHAREFSRRTGVAVEVEGPDPAVRFASEQEMALFRIAQAALSNVAQHARASHVWISLERLQRHYRLQVRDDGVGFETHRALASGRWGMTAMRERAEAIGGELRIESSPGKGTRITVEAEA